MKSQTLFNLEDILKEHTEGGQIIYGKMINIECTELINLIKRFIEEEFYE